MTGSGPERSLIFTTLSTPPNKLVSGRYSITHTRKWILERKHVVCYLATSISAPGSRSCMYTSSTHRAQARRGPPQSHSQTPSRIGMRSRRYVGVVVIKRRRGLDALYRTRRRSRELTTFFSRSNMSEGGQQRAFANRIKLQSAEQIRQNTTATVKAATEKVHGEQN